MLRPGVIRVYVGFRDVRGATRIGYVDVDADNPSNVISISKSPVLDIGRGGAFDDNGVILGDVIVHDGHLRMYYVGFQQVAKVKFLAFTGLAISTDGGESFSRQTEAPILDRSDEGLYIRAIHSVRFENDCWRVWYAAGNSWEMIGGKPFPNYHVRYLESIDGIHFPARGSVCIELEGPEYRIGRPRVYRSGSDYEMYYTKGTIQGDYLPGYARSSDGITWRRMDNQIGLAPSPKGWDSQALCYLSLILSGDKIFGFYNGNNFGVDGFGYAVLDKS
jgi:hypothetical protein